MARQQARFVCQQCGAFHAKWTGRCDGCGAWNSLIEELPREELPGGRIKEGPTAVQRPRARLCRPRPGRAYCHRGARPALSSSTASAAAGSYPARRSWVGGDPGIGKSTLFLQAAAAIAPGEEQSPGQTAIAAYITGEEAIDQGSPARASVSASPRASCCWRAASNVRDIIASLDREDAPALVVVDLIQTMYLDTLDSAPGTVSQVRAAAQELIRVAKRRGFVLVPVGHVTKEGCDRRAAACSSTWSTPCSISRANAGTNSGILRAVKNRFGATDEIGAFEMSDRGLVEVPNPRPCFSPDGQARRRGR